jgi:hypothetical protein
MYLLILKQKFIYNFLIICLASNLENDLRILKILDEIENLDGGFNK